MKMYQVDAFSSSLFKGNPAAVIVTTEWLDDDLMQQIAMENNLSETAFVKIRDQENFEIRWFAPLMEVDFCGHATLASSYILFREYTSAKQIQFHVKNLGIFVVHQEDDGKIRMNFPIRQAQEVQDYPELLQQALHFPIQRVYLNAQAYIVEYANVQQVQMETPDLQLLAQLGKTRTVITAPAGGFDVAITAAGEAQGKIDCVSRYFAPGIGIPEDPVTGSIHTAIAPLWADRLGKNQITAYQASARGGLLYCEILGDRIEISGEARLYMTAELHLEASS